MGMLLQPQIMKSFYGDAPTTSDNEKFLWGCSYNEKFLWGCRTTSDNEKFLWGCPYIQPQIMKVSMGMPLYTTSNNESFYGDAPTTSDNESFYGDAPIYNLK